MYSSIVIVSELGCVIVLLVQELCYEIVDNEII